jgi:integrase
MEPKITVSKDSDAWKVFADWGRDLQSRRRLRRTHRLPKELTRDEAMAQALLWAKGQKTPYLLQDQLAQYLAARKVEGLAAQSLKKYRSMFRLVGASIRQPVATDVTRQDVARLVRDLLDRPLSGNYVNGIISILGAAFDWMIDEHGIREDNPVRGVSRPRYEKSEVTPLDEMSIARLIGWMRAQLGQDEDVRSRSLAFGCWAGLYLGLRNGEVCALRVRDYSAIAGTIHVAGTAIRTKRGVVRQDRPKTTSSRRSIDLPASWQQVVAAHILWQQSRLGTLSSESPLLSLDGSLTTTNWLQLNFRQLSGELGLNVSKFHDLRHTNASLMLAAGTPLAVVSRHLGHARESTTADVYSHALLSGDRQALERLGRSFSALPTMSPQRANPQM